MIDGPLNASATTGATTVKIVPAPVGTNAEGGGTRSKGLRDNAA